MCTGGSSQKARRQRQRSCAEKLLGRRPFFLIVLPSWKNYQANQHWCFCRRCWVPSVPARLLTSICTGMPAAFHLYRHACCLPSVPACLLPSICTGTPAALHPYRHACLLLFDHKESFIFRHNGRELGEGFELFLRKETGEKQRGSGYLGFLQLFRSIYILYAKLEVKWTQIYSFVREWTTKCKTNSLRPLTCRIRPWSTTSVPVDQKNTEIIIIIKQSL